MQAFVGAEATRANDDGFAIETPRGMIEVVTPAAFIARFGVKAPEVARGSRLAAIRFIVVDANLLQAVPELAGIAGFYAGNAAVIGRTMRWARSWYSNPTVDRGAWRRSANSN
jgi:hypothetical protein